MLLCPILEARVVVTFPPRVEEPMILCVVHLNVADADGRGVFAKIAPWLSLIHI